MKIDLKEYLEHRDRFTSATKSPGPVITLSREFGCGGTLIARKLTQVLSEAEGSHHTWKYISKEILYDSAQKLKLDPRAVQNVLHPHDKNFIEDLFASLTTNYQVEEKKIHKTIRDVISSYANLGKVIILGQGGVAITKHIKKSIHVKIIAPLDWRAEQLSKQLDISVKEAKKRAIEHDHRRTLCVNHFMGKPTDYSIFDMLLNASTLSSREMVHQIIELVEVRKLITSKSMI